MEGNQGMLILLQNFVLVCLIIMEMGKLMEVRELLELIVKLAK
jgi:hypothetical protein